MMLSYSVTVAVSGPEPEPALADVMVAAGIGATVAAALLWVTVANVLGVKGLPPLPWPPC